MYPRTIRQLSAQASEHLQKAITAVVYARHSPLPSEALAAYHEAAAFHIEQAIIWIKDISQ